MADPTDAGTHLTPPAGGDHAGTTGAGGGDGGEQGGKPVDFALAMAWKEKAEAYNRAEAERQKAEAEAEQLRQQMLDQQRRAYGGVTQAEDPRASALRALAEKAQYDEDARLQYNVALVTMQTAAAVEAEARLSREIYKAGVPRDKVDVVEATVRNSNYTISVSDALRMHQTPGVPAEVQAEIDRLRKQVQSLQDASTSRTGPAWAGGSGGAPAFNGETMTFDEYNSRVRSGDTELRAKVDAGKVKLVVSKS